MEPKRFLAYDSMDATTPRESFGTEQEALTYALTTDWVLKIVDTNTNEVIYTYDPTDTD